MFPALLLHLARAVCLFSRYERRMRGRMSPEGVPEGFMCIDSLHSRNLYIMKVEKNSPVVYLDFMVIRTPGHAIHVGP